MNFFDPWLEIDTNHIGWNVDQVRKKIGPTPIMAVIKCNAYGHGIVGVAKALQKKKIDRFAVAKVHEAVCLRENGIEGMILNFGGFSPDEAELLVKHDISQSVFSETVEVLGVAARKIRKKVKVHIKIDTGLGRVGVRHQEALKFIDKVAALTDLRIEGVFTTLTEEDDVDPVQIDNLVDIYDKAEKKGIRLGLKHAASSLAVVHNQPRLLDMVRSGNCLLGIESLPGLDLRPVMVLKTKVIFLKDMRPGESLGYHQRFKIVEPMRLATIPLGYSDGYPISALNKAQVLISGRRRPMIGYMSANHVFIDVTGDQTVRIGDEVVLIGRQGKENISIGEIAKWAESTVYRVAVNMNSAIPRVFI